MGFFLKRRYPIYGRFCFWLFFYSQPLRHALRERVPRTDVQQSAAGNDLRQEEKGSHVPGAERAVGVQVGDKKPSTPRRTCGWGVRFFTIVTFVCLFWSPEGPARRSRRTTTRVSWPPSSSSTTSSTRHRPARRRPRRRKSRHRIRPRPFRVKKKKNF